MVTAVPGERQRSLFIGALATTLYLATLSRWYSADSLQFANAVDSPNPADRIDVYHLLLHPLGWLWVQAWRFGGWTGPSIHPLQVINAIAGGISIALVCSIAIRVSRSIRAATVAAIGCTVSGGIWLLATEAEDVTLGLVAHLAVLRLMLSVECVRTPRTSSALWLGIATGVATLTYANCALLLLIGALVQWQRRSVQPAWLRECVAMMAGFAGVIAPAVLIAGVHTLPTGGAAYGFFSRESLPRGMYAFVRTLALFPGLGINDSTAAFLKEASGLQRTTFVATYAVTGLIATAPVVLLRRLSPSNDLHQRLLLWAVLYAAFAFWWVPSDLEFWAPVTIAWWIGVALLMVRRALDARAVLAVAVGLFLVNGLGLILPHRQAAANAPLQAALQLGPELRPADLVIASPVMDEFLNQFVRPGNIRITATQLRAAIAHAKARIDPKAGRIFIAGIDPDTSAADRGEQARLLFETPGYRVWELVSEASP